MTKTELLKIYYIKLELLEEVREERNLIFDLWKFYTDKGIAKSHRYVNQLSKLYEEINELNDELTSIRKRMTKI